MPLSRMWRTIDVLGERRRREAQDFRWAKPSKVLGERRRREAQDFRWAKPSKFKRSFDA
jgi:hypothetical protein